MAVQSVAAVASFAIRPCAPGSPSVGLTWLLRTRNPLIYLAFHFIRFILFIFPKGIHHCFPQSSFSFPGSIIFRTFPHGGGGGGGIQIGMDLRVRRISSVPGLFRVLSIGCLVWVFLRLGAEFSLLYYYSAVSDRNFLCGRQSSTNKGGSCYFFFFWPWGETSENKNSIRRQSSIFVILRNNSNIWWHFYFPLFPSNRGHHSIGTVPALFCF